MAWLWDPHAAYIWPSYAVAFLVVGGLITWSWMTYFTAKKKLKDAELRGKEHS